MLLRLSSGSATARRRTAIRQQIAVVTVGTELVHLTEVPERSRTVALGRRYPCVG